MNNLQSLIVPPKSAFLEFDLRASERTKEVHKNEYAYLCTTMKNSKIEIRDLFKKLVTKASDWETMIMTLTRIEKVERALLKLSKSLVKSMIIQHSKTIEDLNLINSKSLQASVLTTEDIVSKDSINLEDFTITKFADVLRTYKN